MRPAPATVTPLAVPRSIPCRKCSRKLFPDQSLSLMSIIPSSQPGIFNISRVEPLDIIPEPAPTYEDFFLEMKYNEIHDLKVHSSSLLVHEEFPPTFNFPVDSVVLMPDCSNDETYFVEAVESPSSSCEHKMLVCSEIW